MKVKIIISTIVIVFIVLGGCFAYKIYSDKKAEEEAYRLYFDLYQERLDEYSKENKTKTDVDVVFIGDSLTDGYDIDSFYPDYVALNRGIGGDRIEWLIDRMVVSAYDVNPKVIVVLIAGNDVLAGRSTDYILTKYNELIDKIKTNLPDTRIIIQSHYPTGKDYADKNAIMLELNRLEEKMASSKGCVFVDIYPHLLDDSGKLADNFTTDGVHINNDGYQIVTDLLTPEIDKLLSENNE